MRSSSTSSIYLCLGLPLDHLPTGLHSTIFLGNLCCSVLIVCPSQGILLLFTNLLYQFPVLNYLFLRILHEPSLFCNGPKMFLGIFRSNILRDRSSFCVNKQVWHVYITTDLIILLYIFNFNHLLSAFDFTNLSSALSDLNVKGSEILETSDTSTWYDMPRLPYLTKTVSKGWLKQLFGIL